ncbi:unnamed protein product, partial [marine sediment metagenome]
NKLISCAVARTKDILKLIQEGECSEQHTGGDQIGQAFFYVIKWTSFAENKIYIRP